jgi:hypothetical protein
MIIAINDDWRLASDPLQWTLQKQKLVKGEERWRSLAFFGDLDRAICELVRRRIHILPGGLRPGSAQPTCNQPKPAS